MTVGGCGFITRRVCVLRPSSSARTMGAENKIGRSFVIPAIFVLIDTPRANLPISTAF
jgi:hypothetical protein